MRLWYKSGYAARDGQSESGGERKGGREKKKRGRKQSKKAVEENEKSEQPDSFSFSHSFCHHLVPGNHDEQPHQQNPMPLLVNRSQTTASKLGIENIENISEPNMDI